MTITAKTCVNKTKEFSPLITRQIVKGINTAGSPAVFWTGKQFLWLSEFGSGYQITSGNPQLHSNNEHGFFVEEFHSDVTDRELQDLFASVIPEGSVVTYPVLTKLELPLSLKVGDSDKKVRIYKNDTLVAIYEDNVCYSGIKKDEMKKLLPQLFSDPEYVKIQENPDGVFLASFS